MLLIIIRPHQMHSEAMILSSSDCRSSAVEASKRFRMQLVSISVQLAAEDETKCS